MKKAVVFVLTFIGLLFLAPPVASAHGQVTDTFPKNNSKLVSMPDEVWFEFDGNLTVLEGADVNTLVVKDASGRALQTGKAIVAGARIYATIAIKDVSGRISANYRVVSEDGHPVEGSMQFTVQSNAIAETPEPATAQTEIEPTTPTLSANPEVSATGSEPSATATSENTTADAHVEHNFFQRHTTHFIQFGFGFAVIGIWYLNDRRRSK